MVKTPWVEASELRTFTSFEDVKSRSDFQLEVFIQRATNRIVNYTHHRFDNGETDGVTEVPSAIKTVCILIAEALAHNDTLTSSRRVKSESYDDYSATYESSTISVDDLLSDIPEEYVKSHNGNIKFDLFKL